MELLTTDKESCNKLAALLLSHGVRRCVVSPGSRNAPIFTALSATPGMAVEVIVDERCAGFFALGEAVQSGEPVAVVCTSGTALLNLAPATAEAYYRGVPLIVISADRPAEWIDQDDSQTMRQFEALAPFVKNSYDLPATVTEPLQWMTVRLINDAMLTALSGRRGPVHINVQLDAPLGNMVRRNAGNAPRKIEMIVPQPELPTARARELGRRLAAPVKVLIIAGFMAPDNALNKAMRKLARKPNIVVMTETVANLHGDEFVSCIDRTLCRMAQEDVEAMCPDIVITTGGALVSRFVKKFIRENPPREHWHVGCSHTTVDCFKALTLRVEMAPAIFFRQLASAVQPADGASDYAARWKALDSKATDIHRRLTAAMPWSDFSAFRIILDSIPADWNLHFSNGTPIRYSQLFTRRFHRVECNRGVSGIDGSTSTALGAAEVTRGVTLLISGDMSAQYDMGAFASVAVSPRFKMIVMVNGGGAIFHFVDSTACLANIDSFVGEPARLPLEDIARGFGFRYFRADDETSLKKALKEFIAVDDAPALLGVHTSSRESAGILRKYFTES